MKDKAGEMKDKAVEVAKDAAKDAVKK